MKFKTNAKCGGCSAKIIKSLEKLSPAEMWEIDLTSPDKTLSYKGEWKDGMEKEIIELVAEAGFKAEPIL